MLESYDQPIEECPTTTNNPSNPYAISIGDFDKRFGPRVAIWHWNYVKTPDLFPYKNYRFNSALNPRWQDVLDHSINPTNKINNLAQCAYS